MFKCIRLSIGSQLFSKKQFVHISYTAVFITFVSKSITKRTLLAKIIRTILISAKKGVRKKPSAIFKRLKFLQYSKTMMVFRNKPDVIRKNF